MNEEIQIDEPTIDQAPELNWTPTITIMSGVQKGEIHALEPNKDFFIGRGRQCDLWLDAKDVSRKHAKISVVDGKFILEDLGSKWGTRIEGSPITKQEIKYSEEFEVAGVLLKFDMSLRSELTGRRRNIRRIILYILLVAALITAGTLYYFKSEFASYKSMPGSDNLSQIIHHYDKGINIYNTLDGSNPQKMEEVIREMEIVIKLDPHGKTKFSRSARRIIDGLEK